LTSNRLGIYEADRRIAKKIGTKENGEESYPIALSQHRLLASVEQAKGAKEPLIVVLNQPFPNPLKL